MAQFYSFGTDPSSARWRQIQGDHFKMIYPEEIDSLAREYLYTLEKYRDAVNEPLRIDPLQIPVILHPYTTISNGMVAWCPKGMHLITSPNPYSDSQVDWMIQLSTHEQRHVAQTEHFTRGWYRWVYPLLGESITGIGMGIFANTSLLEGDAVMSETMLTAGGRGRMASFLMQLRADYLEGFYRNPEGHLLPSYHYKPYDKYAVGFMAMSSETVRTGDYHFPAGFYWAQAIKLGGYMIPKDKRPYWDYDENFADMQRLFTDIWKKDYESRGEFTRSERISGETGLYCDYTGAMYIQDTLSHLHGSIVALKQGMEYVEEMVRIAPDGRESHLRYHAPYSSKMSGDDSGRLYWSESVMHDPSSAESFSEIKYYDVRADELGTLTYGTKYFNPSVCDCGNHIAVAEYPVGKSSRLVLVSASDGCEIAAAEAPDCGQVQETAFVGDSIYATVIFPEGVGIWRIDEHAMMEGRGVWEEVLPAQPCELRNIRCYGRGLCFASDIDGVLNIYAYQVDSGELYRLTNSRYGANYPFVDREHGMLYYSDFDRKGYYLARLGIDSLSNDKVEWAVHYTSPVVDKLVSQRDEQSKITEIKGNADFLNPERYPSKRYNKFLHSFKIHTWAPFYYNVDRIKNMSGDNLYELVSLGVVAYLQNDLGTVRSMLGYSYHNGFHSGHAKVMSVIADFDVEASFDINDRKQIVYERTPVGGYHATSGNRPFCNFGLTVDYPLNLYSGGWSSMLVPSVSWNVSNDRFNSERSYCDNSASVGVRYYRMLSTATSAIFPRWGYSIDAYHSLSLSTREKMPLTYVGAYAYLPGITRTQGVKLSVQAQMRHTGKGIYYNNSYASLPRGYSFDANGLPSEKYLKFTVDYAIPIWIGDLTIPHAFYFKRLKLIPFGDYAIERTLTSGDYCFWSAGTDLTVDFSVIRFRFEASCGVRYAYTGPQGELKRNTFSFLFNIKI